MKIKLLTSYSGPDGSHGPGAVIDIDSKEAQRYIDKGLAELPVKESKKKVKKK